MEDKQKLEQLAAELNELQQRGEAITQQIEQLNVSYKDIKTAEETVKGLEGAVGKETLIPIGAGCFITTELKSEDVIVGIGSDVAIKKSSKETLETLEKDEKEIQDLINTLTEQLQKINDYITEKRPEAERLMKETGVQ